MTDAESIDARPLAVSYLRVSTKDQATRDGGIEGYSIPAQREANLRAAGTLGALVIEEFVDAGESARSADRPALKAMLEYVAREPVSYVVVHKVDRLARNRIDDVEINVALQAAGVRLVSATESIDETPSGMLLHGIMSTIAEFYSQNLAAEVRKGIDQKVRSGGTVSRAPLGFRNVRRVDSEGREVRTVEMDPDRAPLVAYAFERFARGDTTVRLLAEELAARGLHTPRTPKRASKPMYPQLLYKVLTNPYYKGLVSLHGVTYQGRHGSLVPSRTWDAVQLALAAHNTGEKDRLYPHCLRGSLYCARCGRRMIFHNARGNGGTYPYFICGGRHGRATDCDLPAVTVAAIEEKVTALYASVALPPERIESLETELAAEIEEASRESSELRRDLTAHRDELEARRRKLLDAHMAGAVPLDLMKEEQEAIGAKLRSVNERLAAADVEYEAVRSTLSTAIGLIADCHDLYRRAPDPVRRQLNQVFFERIEVDVEEDVIVTGELREPFRTISERAVATARLEREEPLTGMPPVKGSKETVLVDLRSSLWNQRAGLEAASSAARRARRRAEPEPSRIVRRQRFLTDGERSDRRTLRRRKDHSGDRRGPRCRPPEDQQGAARCWRAAAARPAHRRGGRRVRPTVRVRLLARPGRSTARVVAADRAAAAARARSDDARHTRQAYSFPTWGERRAVRVDPPFAPPMGVAVCSLRRSMSSIRSWHGNLEPFGRCDKQCSRFDALRAITPELGDYPGELG